MLKVIVVDDEETMRFVLKRALSKFSNVKIVGEASNGKEAVHLVETLKVDGVFMDVEMPNMDGIEAAKLMLDIQPKIMLIFITAHQQYMPQAFELYAFDYMIKPFKLERLKQTLNRMISTLSPSISDTLLIKNREQMSILNQDEIILIQRENRNTVIITSTNKYITTQTLSELEQKLNKNIFIRSHKSYIINKDKINQLLPYGRWTYIVKFKDIQEDALVTSQKIKELENIYKNS